MLNNLVQMNSGRNNGVRPQCCSLTPLLVPDPVAGSMERLVQAKEMFEGGLLSDAEYEAIKAKIVTEL